VAEDWPTWARLQDGQRGVVLQMGTCSQQFGGLRGNPGNGD